MERLTLEEVWELPIRQTLNDLSYLKAKKENDKALIKLHNLNSNIISHG